MAITRSFVKGPEGNPWYWNPNRVSIKFAPDWFMKQVREIGDELSITWNPIIERWQVWGRAPRINNPICQGWRLLFVHNDADGGYLPLDETVLARLYACSVLEHGSAKRYFDRVLQEKIREEEERERRFNQESQDRAEDYRQYGQIKNIGHGSKWSNYFS